MEIWQHFGLKNKKLKYKMVLKTQDRTLGLLIDIVDTEKPNCLETFLEKFCKEQLGLNASMEKKMYTYLSGYYNALDGMRNKEYFFNYYQDWAYIFPLLGCKSKRIQSRYNFFYQYIIEHGLVISTTDLQINENDIKKNFKKIDERSYNRILQNLLSKVFDGKLKNDKETLLGEIEKNLQNY
jgi:tRNA nucleotidyltransferase/poly(A) polymerase